MKSQAIAYPAILLAAFGLTACGGGGGGGGGGTGTAATSYPISVQVSGLNGLSPITVQSNGGSGYTDDPSAPGEDLTITQDGTQTFNTRIAIDTNYLITLVPTAGQLCRIIDDPTDTNPLPGSGPLTVASAPVSGPVTVKINCTKTRAVSGTTHHLVGGLMLRNTIENATGKPLFEDIYFVYSKGGSQPFGGGLDQSLQPIEIPVGNYEIAIATKSRGQTCSLKNQDGTTIGSVKGNSDTPLSGLTIDCTLDNEVNAACDTGTAALASIDPVEAAHAMGVCKGLTEATWQLPGAGTLNSTQQPRFDLGHGIQTASDAPNSQLAPRAGTQLLMLSTGSARFPSQAPDYINPAISGADVAQYSSEIFNNSVFPRTDYGGPYATQSYNPDQKLPVFHGVRLSLKLMLPEGANGFIFKYRSLITDYPNVGTAYADQIAAYVSPTTDADPIILKPHDMLGMPNDTNVDSSDKPWHPHDPSRLTVCAQQSSTTIMINSTAETYDCTNVSGDLTGTDYTAGSAWLTASSGIIGRPDKKEEVTLDLMIWDHGDGEKDSAILFDDFKWVSF
ncbi:MAG: hypothetical protein HY940_00030 [Gammaproteobacteria bacterium]|nr:hypothetical protein [Gammaproteobacteria bacterium]